MKFNNTYYIIRHGLSTSNVQSYLSAWPEKKISRLTPEGKQTIKKAAQSFKKIGIDLIFTSDLHRTQQTAQIISKITGAKIIIDKGLRELDPGIFNNTYNGDYTGYFKTNEERLTRRPPQGENLLDCQKRMAKVLKKINQKYKNKKVLIVSHGNPLWMLEAFAKGWDRSKTLKEYKNRIIPGEWRKIN